MQDSEDQNPYAAPLAIEIPPVVATGSLYYRDGDFLVIRDGAVLPPRCVHTNHEIGPDDWTKRVRMTWTPPWVFLFILVHVLILILVALLVNKKAWLTYSLSREARGRLIKRRSIAFIVFLAGIAGAVGSGVYLNGNWSIGLTILCSLIALVAVFVLALTNAIRVKKHDDGWFTLKGCSREFLDSL